MRVFVPYHVSGVWLPIYGGSPIESGSLGVGVVLSSGVTLSSERLEGSRPLELDPTTSKVLELYGASRDEVSNLWIVEQRPLGYGYGASAARALALALMIEVSRGRGSVCRAGEVAHVAEVVCGSGLGDVIAELEGMGLVQRVRHGPPCRGVVHSFIPSKRYEVVTAPLGRMSTREMHEVFGERIRRLAPRYIELFAEQPSIERFLEVAHGFSVEVGFLTKGLEDRVNEALRSFTARGIVLGFFVKKKLLVMMVEPSYGSEVAESVAKGLRVDPAIDYLGTGRAVVEV